jgi:nickel-dependent lactate racemase
MTSPVSSVAPPNRRVSPEQVADALAKTCPPERYRDQRVLVIIPDGTRTAPVGLLFQTLFRQIGAVTRQFDVIAALGTHQPMSEEQFHERLEISAAERTSIYGRVRFFNHEWDNPKALRQVGTISRDEISDLTQGLFAMDVPVEINARVFDYDHLIVIGPVFPHEVVGFSGGNKYLFPGIGGPQILNFFHWLAAVTTNPMIIGNQWTAVRRVVDKAGTFVPIEKTLLAMVVSPDKSLAGLFTGSMEGAWNAAVQLSQAVHIEYCDQPFHTVLSCAPRMYDELWVGGKCMYKLEPVVADGGELIIYAPHIEEVCITHGENIRQVGYHCRDYFLKQWDRFKDIPWGVLAHCTHVYGLGTYENGVETPRVRVTLATGISPETCRQINLGYRDWRTIRVEDFQNREAEGVLHVPKAGEMLYKLKNPPRWAGGQGQ